jgi:hypothetical protein
VEGERRRREGIEITTERDLWQVGRIDGSVAFARRSTGKTERWRKGRRRSERGEGKEKGREEEGETCQRGLRLYICDEGEVADTSAFERGQAEKVTFPPPTPLLSACINGAGEGRRRGGGGKEREQEGGGWG